LRRTSKRFIDERNHVAVIITKATVGTTTSRAEVEL